jgi:hypothetical protein
MKAIAKCPKCEETITTDCRGCIEGNSYGCSEHGEKFHKCQENDNIIEDVKWKKVPEDEKELKEIEEEK